MYHKWQVGIWFDSMGLARILIAEAGYLLCALMMSFIRIARRLAGSLKTAGVLVAGVASGSAIEAMPQWIVVTPPEFREALTPLIQYRAAEGFTVVVLSTTDVVTPDKISSGEGEALRTKLSELCKLGKGTSYILLAGVSRPGLTNTGATVPALRGIVGRMKGLGTDAGYGLPGQDGSPTVAIGRFPARDREEVEAMVRKTLRFEQASRPAPWRNRMLLLVGNPGGGPLAEMFMAQTLVTELATLHESWVVRTLFNAELSAYYLPRSPYRERGLRYVGEGNLFSIYLGHSSVAGLGLDGKFMTSVDWAKLSIPEGAGPFFTCGCFACQSDPQAEGYGIAAMRNVNGPIAVVGATGESYSAPGKLAIEGLLACVRQPPFPSRLGDYWLGVARGLAGGEMDETTFALLDMADGSRGRTPLAAQRREHLEMWLLLGDPAMRMPIVPTDITIETPQPITAAKDFEVRGSLPGRLKGATVQISLERQLISRAAEQTEIPPQTPENRSARERAFIDRHQGANSFVLTTVETKAAGDKFAASIQAPPTMPWSNVVVRVTAALSNETGMGVICVPVRP
jgi:hypothetical protein